jgi:hypothetical protein
MADWPYCTEQWQRLRKLKLSTDPLCEYCQPHRLTPAREVDHKDTHHCGRRALVPGEPGERMHQVPFTEDQGRRTGHTMEAEGVRRGRQTIGRPLVEHMRALLLTIALTVVCITALDAPVAPPIEVLQFPPPCTREHKEYFDSMQPFDGGPPTRRIYGPWDYYPARHTWAVDPIPLTGGGSF